MAEATSTPILRTLGRCLWSPRGSSSKHLGQSHPSVPVTANSRTVRNHSFSSLAAVQRTFKKLPVPSEARPRTLHRCWKDGLQFTFALFTATAPVVRSDLAAWPGRTVGAGHPPRQLLAFPPFVSDSCYPNLKPVRQHRALGVLRCAAASLLLRTGPREGSVLALLPDNTESTPRPDLARVTETGLSSRCSS